jgi:probable phosphoglycerate mutase
MRKKSLTTRVIIVRHGQSSYNAQKMIQGRCDESVITEKGAHDAQILGKTLNQVKLGGFYCSPLQRAKKTAEIMQQCLETNPGLTVAENLLEIDLPLWEKCKKEEVKTKYSNQYRIWKERPHEFTMTVEGKELYPVLSLYQQAREFWQEVIPKHQGETILLVAHNGINRCLLMTALGIEPSRYHSIQQSNCCINVLNFTGGWGEPVQLESLNQTSHLGIDIPEPRPGHRGVRLLLVRHGETEWNRLSRFQGVKDIPLNETGRQQGQKAAAFLKDVKLDFAVTSPLLRPKETAEIILQYHPQVALELKTDLAEISHGLWEGKLDTEIEAEFPGLLNQWKQKPETVQMPEGENLQQVWERAVKSWQEIVSSHSNNPQPKTGIVVAHDAINKVIICHLLGLNPANFWNIKQGNGAVTVIDYPQGLQGLPVLQAINITTHLGAGIFDRTAAGAL